jgi:hypothetical protein
MRWRFWDSCPRKIGTGLSSLSLSSLISKETQNKGPVPFGAEPFILDSAMVALNAHEKAHAHSQGFHTGF